MAPAPVPVPALPPAMDTKDEGDGGAKNQSNMVADEGDGGAKNQSRMVADEGDGGAKNQSRMVVDEGDGGAKNQNSMVVVKSEAVCTNGGPLVVGTELVKYEGGDTTECSSSFGDTCSGFEGEADNGEPEVNSGLSAHADGVGPSKPPRRKKVMAEWSNSVRPIQWRCHWLELRMRELSSQVSKYDRELALIKKQKESQQVVSKANGTMSESMQIHKDKGHGNSIMKRRKRKRHEENVDASLYINKHRILSFYHDKQNKGAETNGVLVDDDCGTVDGSMRGGLDTATLLDSEDYDMICEQRTLQDILLTIDGVQSRVHLLQDRLTKAHSEGENLAFSGGDTHVRVARKRQRTQKHSFSYTKSRHTKPQKKKNLNILLKDDGQALAGGSALPDRETDAHIIGTGRSSEERSGECNHLRDKAITLDLLLGTGNSITNSDIGDLYKVNTDDILIDNQGANEACEQFYKAKQPSGSSSKDQNISTPAEMKNNSPPVEVKNTCAAVKVESICAPVEVDSTSAPALEQESFLEKSPSRKPVSPGNKQELEPKKRQKKKVSFFTKKQRKEASKTPDAKEKTEGMSSAAKNQRSTPSDVAKEKTKSTLSAATGPGGKKRKSGNEPADAKMHRSLNSSLASKEQKTGKPSSAVKKQKTEKTAAAAKAPKAENAGSATKKQETESSSSTEKKLETASASLKLQVEKAVLVVNSRRSQRVRKPKVFAE